MNKITIVVLLAFIISVANATEDTNKTKSLKVQISMDGWCEGRGYRVFHNEMTDSTEVVLREKLTPSLYECIKYCVTTFPTVVACDWRKENGYCTCKNQIKQILSNSAFDRAYIYQLM